MLAENVLGSDYDGIKFRFSRKIPGKNWTGDKKNVVVDGRDPNIARPFIRGGVYIYIYPMIDMCILTSYANQIDLIILLVLLQQVYWLYLSIGP